MKIVEIYNKLRLNPNRGNSELKRILLHTKDLPSEDKKYVGLYRISHRKDEIWKEINPVFDEKKKQHYFNLVDDGKSTILGDKTSNSSVIVWVLKGNKLIGFIESKSLQFNYFKDKNKMYGIEQMNERSYVPPSDSMNFYELAQIKSKDKKSKLQDKTSKKCKSEEFFTYERFYIDPVEKEPYSDDQLDALIKELDDFDYIKDKSIVSLEDQVFIDLHNNDKKYLVVMTSCRRVDPINYYRINNKDEIKLFQNSHFHETEEVRIFILNKNLLASHHCIRMLIHYNSCGLTPLYESELSDESGLILTFYDKYSGTRVIVNNKILTIES